MTPHPLNLIPKRHHVVKSPVIPTKQHCLRVKKLLDCPLRSSMIYLKGKNESTRDNTDVDLEFRQESYFFYLTGVEEPGFQVIFHIQKERVYLIKPQEPENEVIWKGPNYTAKELLEKYDADDIISQADLPRLISKLHVEMTYCLNQHQAQEFSTIALLPAFSTMDSKLLLPVMNEARLIKFSWEIDIIRQVMYASSQAHIALMQQFQPGMTEMHLAALFRWACALHQVYKQAYLPIVGSGPRAAILHYTKNSQLIASSSPHMLVLVDAGGEKLCYGSDITRTWPVNGVFTIEAKAIYNIVLKMQETVLSQLKPGVSWSDMSQLATRILCVELVKLGILRCENEDELEEIIDMGIPSAFYFHGRLGHTVGLDVHDVGGRDDRSECKEDDLPEFLLNRPLEKNMVLTVEPGLYFNDAMLDIWIHYPGYGKYFNLDTLEKYRVVGGVRIEDTVVITHDGYENLTVAPKQIHEIEQLMSRATAASN